MTLNITKESIMAAAHDEDFQREAGKASDAFSKLVEALQEGGISAQAVLAGILAVAADGLVNMRPKHMDIPDAIESGCATLKLFGLQFIEVEKKGD